jgi:hypothetical protein
MPEAAADSLDAASGLNPDSARTIARILAVSLVFKPCCWLDSIKACITCSWTAGDASPHLLLLPAGLPCVRSIGSL